jgi:hypothetical protein
MANVRELRDTLALNFRMRHWPQQNVFDPLNEPVEMMARIRQERADIDANRNLSPVGKVEARNTAKQRASEAVKKWHEPNLAGLDAHIAEHRAGLLPKGTPPDPKRVEFMAALMQRYTPEENAVFYTSADDSDRVVMEAASALLGRVPLKTQAGQQWRPLLDPDRVTETVMERAIAQNPRGVERLNELREIRAMHVTIANHALAEIDEVMSR